MDAGLSIRYSYFPLLPRHLFLLDSKHASLYLYVCTSVCMSLYIFLITYALTTAPLDHAKNLADSTLYCSLFRQCEFERLESQDLDGISSYQVRGIFYILLFAVGFSFCCLYFQVKVVVVQSQSYTSTTSGGREALVYDLLAFRIQRNALISPLLPIPKIMFLWQCSILMCPR